MWAHLAVSGLIDAAIRAQLVIELELFAHYPRIEDTRPAAT